ncbi:MAG: multi-sensor signal transduction histidine kinase [Acidobacteria bacterium]|nr:multi-sensor signal transduction histidine kinase [Acidobacteriota bacterium]
MPYRWGGFHMTWGRSPKNKSSSKPRLGSSWRGLILQLFLVTVLPLTLLVIAFTFGSLVLHQRAMRSLVGERDQLAVRTAAGALTEQVRQRVNAVRLLSVNAQGVNTDDLNDLLSSIDFLQPDFDYGLAFFSNDGVLETATGDPALWERPLAALVPDYETLLARNESAIVVPGTFAYSQTGDRLVLILAADPNRQRITVGAFSAATLAQRILEGGNSNGPSTSYLLMDRDREIIYRIGFLFSEDELRSHAGIAEALNGESGATYQQVGDSEHVVAYSPVDTLGWALVSEEPWEMVDTPFLRTTLAAPLVLVPVLILALLALWFAARQIIRPLQDLETKSAQLALGNFQSIEGEVGGIAEIRRLQAGLIHMAHQVKAAQQSLHNYIGVITTTQEDERRRLARELHDETIQSLIALKQRVQLARLTRQNERETSSLKEIESMTEQTIEELRRLTRALRPIYLEDLGLVTALEMLARETGQSAGIPVEFQRQGVERRLETATELALYRMAQELLSNVARHSQASCAALDIMFTTQAVTLLVKDNGKGFDVPKRPSEFAPGGHFGLLGLFERCEMIGAQLEILSQPGEGSRVTIVVPEPAVDK